MRMGLGFWLAFLSVIFTARSACSGESDFRGVTWGMGRITVMASEKGVPEPVWGSYLSYQVWLLDRVVFLRYRFVENRLVEARYVFSVKSRMDLDLFKDYLEKKYGKTKTSSSDADLKDGMEWETSRTRIRMEADEDGWARILYGGKEMANWLEARSLLEKQKIQEDILNLF